MCDDLAMIRGELVIRCLGVGSIGQMIIEHAEITHLTDPIFKIRVKMA